MRCESFASHTLDAPNTPGKSAQPKQSQVPAKATRGRPYLSAFEKGPDMYSCHKGEARCTSEESWHIGKCALQVLGLHAFAALALVQGGLRGAHDAHLG